MTSADLQFDKMVVDTNLAQKYMEKNFFKFHSIGCEDNGDVYCDQANNEIYFGNNNVDYCVKDTKNYPVNLHLLAEEIENNIDLFCQLEFLIRQIPIETTQRELKMIVKHIRYCCSLENCPMRTFYLHQLTMTNDASLIDLGFVADLHGPLIVAEENMAVVCHLFTELCRDSGIEMKLCFKKCTPDMISKSISRNKVVEGGCIGVVTAQCDIESAVDVFLSVPKGVLWGLRRILVQESACERFKRELAWKTRSASQADVDPKLKSLCTDSYVHEGKVFLGEYVGGDSDVPDVVLIESFRTVKELLTLMEGYQPFCVSLWSHGVAESNEIAFGISAPMVWVNRYGTVGEDPQVSLAYYSHINYGSYRDNVQIDKVRKIQKNWMRLTLSERRKKIMAMFENLPAKDEYQYYKQCIISTHNEHGNFIQVGSSELVIGVSKPRDVYIVNSKYDTTDIAEILRFLVLGSGFVLYSKVTDDLIKCLEWSWPVKLPVLFGDGQYYRLDRFPPVQYTRVIHTSIGTIFAN